jgi:hypothetical protein
MEMKTCSQENQQQISEQPGVSQRRLQDTVYKRNCMFGNPFKKAIYFTL